MKLYTIDFETRYDDKYSLSKLTTEEYVRDPRFEVILVSIAEGRQPPVWFSGTWSETAKWLKQFDFAAAGVIAHNAMFDGAILAWKFGIYPKFIFDTLSMARPHHGLTVGGSLKKLADHYGLGAKGTEVVNAKGKARTEFNQYELERYAEYCVQDVNLTRRLFQRLRTKTTMDELRLIDSTIRMFTQPRLRLDAPLLEQHLFDVQARRDALLRDAGVTPEVLRSNQKFAELLTSFDIVPPTKISPTTGQETFAFSKQDQAFTDLLNHQDERVAAIAAARLNVRSTLEEKRTERFISIAARGPLPIPLSYCGAHTTSRWSGTDKINLQNLPSGGNLRRAIRAFPGHKMAGGDLSNIEMRVNHKLAGRQESIDAFLSGRDLYVEFAAILFDVDEAELLASYHAGDPEAARKRKVGKVAHLGLGYGCGHLKFQHMARMFGIPLTVQEAKAIVDLWRETYPEIPRLWRAADASILAMYRGSEVVVGEDNLVRTGHIDGGTPAYLLPGKHFIQYTGLSQFTGGWTYQGRNRQVKKLYGGACVENLAQSLARHVLADQWLKFDTWLRANAPQWQIVLQVHDELTAAGPEKDAEAVAAALQQCLNTAPAWWPDLPLASEVHIGETFADMK